MNKLKDALDYNSQLVAHAQSLIAAGMELNSQAWKNWLEMAGKANRMYGDALEQYFDMIHKNGQNDKS